MSEGSNMAVTPKEQNNNSVLQQLGEMIKPDVPNGSVEKIAHEMYGFKVVKCKQLNSYYDKNFHIIVEPTSDNPYVTSVSPDGYVMKVLNSLDTRKSDTIYAQIAMMNHLRSHGIAAQEAVPSIRGDNAIFYPFPSSGGEVRTHAVCVRIFMPGTILYDVTLTRDLCYKVGEFMGSMARVLEDFHHPFFDTNDHLWSLNNVPLLAEYLHIITDPKDNRVVDEVIREFASTVLPRRGEIRKGCVHGDASDQNILVKNNPSHSARNGEGDYVIAGILDYQHAAFTRPIYDLAINIAYVMTTATTFDPLEVGGHILAGYTSVLELPNAERSMLKVLISSRLVQSLVLGAYSHSLDPSNDYLLVTAKRGWHVLHALWDTPSHTLDELYNGIQRSYTADSK